MQAGIEVLGEARRVTELGGQWKVKPFGIFPGAVDQVVDAEDRDVVHQQGDDDLVDLPAGPQQTGDTGPQPAAEKGGEEHRSDHHSRVFEA